MASLDIIFFNTMTNLLLQIPLVILMIIYIVWRFKAEKSSLAKVDKMLKINLVRMIIVCLCIMLQSLTVFVVAFASPERLIMNMYALVMFVLYALIVLYDIVQCVRLKIEKVQKQEVE